MDVAFHDRDFFFSCHRTLRRLRVRVWHSSSYRARAVLSQTTTSIRDAWLCTKCPTRPQCPCLASSVMMCGVERDAQGHAPNPPQHIDSPPGGVLWLDMIVLVRTSGLRERWSLVTVSSEKRPCSPSMGRSGGSMFGGAAHSASHVGRAAHAFPTWCTCVAVLGLNRYVFGFGRLPLRDGHLQDAVLQLGSGLLRLDGRRQGDGPRERPIVEFPLVVILVFRGLVLLHFAFERQGGIGHVDLEVLPADPRYLCFHDDRRWRIGDFNRRFHLAQGRRFSAEKTLEQPIHFAAQGRQSAKGLPSCQVCHSLSPLSCIMLSLCPYLCRPSSTLSRAHPPLSARPGACGARSGRHAAGDRPGGRAGRAD